MSWFFWFKQKVIDGGSCGLRPRTFEDKMELGTSWTTEFPGRMAELGWMPGKCMPVKKKSNRNNKRIKIIMLDRFVEKLGPIVGLDILLNIVQVEQRTQVRGWVHMNVRNCLLWRCHGRCGRLNGERTSLEEQTKLDGTTVDWWAPQANTQQHWKIEKYYFICR
jgi:hypothetical protein